MSALPPKADMSIAEIDVRLVPEAYIDPLLGVVRYGVR